MRARPAVMANVVRPSAGRSCGMPHTRPAAFLRQTTAVEAIEIASEAVGVVSSLHMCPPSPAEAVTLVAVVHQPRQRIRHGPRVTKGHQKPIQPAETRSGTPPTLVATTAVPAAIASISATGVPSLRDVNATTSVAL